MRFIIVSLGVCVALSACGGCGPVGSDVPDSGPPIWVKPPAPDAGPVVIIPPNTDAGVPPVFAGEPCPPETFGLYVEDDGGVEDVPDGSVRFGLCAVVQRLEGNASLDGRPVTGAVTLNFAAGGFASEIEKQVGSLGHVDVRVLRSRYDLLRYQPSGVFPTHKGFIDLGGVDMTKDQYRSLAARSHLMRGAVTLGNLPFTPSTFPADVQIDALGLPRGQNVTTSSQGGSYEVRLLEGTFSAFLSSPPQALGGTELIRYLVSSKNVVLDRDQTFDMELPASPIEGTLTIDGQAIPDRRTGYDFNLSYVVPGENEASVVTHHGGGSPSFAGLVPSGRYSVMLNLVGAPDLQLPSQIFNKQLSSSLDLTRENRLDVDLRTHRIEGGILVDGLPVRPNPNYNWSMWMFGIASSSAISTGLIYDVPMVNSAFSLKAFPSAYFVILLLDDNIADDLAEGFLVVDKYLQVFNDTQLPINIETNLFQGKLLVDGEPPPTNEIAGTMIFRNRALEAQWSTYYRKVRCASDGSFRVRLPKGEYDLSFIIDQATFPEHAAGQQRMLTRVVIKDEPAVVDLNYNTVLVTGPLRLAGEVVKDTLGGAEVGLELLATDGREFTWGFPGGRPNYRMRVPEGDYKLNFVVNRGAFPDEAWGKAPMGLQLGARLPGPVLVPPPQR